MNNNKLKFVIGSLVIIAAVIVLAIQGMQEDTTMSYSKSVSEVQLLGSRAYAMTLKVNGDLKKGSIIRNNLDLDFVITEGNSELSIQKDGIFHAERIQAKCASKYEADYSSPEI